MSFTDITKKDLEGIIENYDPKKTVILDVRGHDEVSATGKIPKALVIPLPELQNTLYSADAWKKATGTEYPAKDVQVVLYCRSGARAGRAATILDQQNFNNLYRYCGGATEWFSN